MTNATQMKGKLVEAPAPAWVGSAFSVEVLKLKNKKFGIVIKGHFFVITLFYQNAIGPIAMEAARQ